MCVSIIMVYKNLDQLYKISLKSLSRDVKLKYNTIQYNGCSEIKISSFKTQTKFNNVCFGSNTKNGSNFVFCRCCCAVSSQTHYCCKYTNTFATQCKKIKENCFACNLINGCNTLHIKISGMQSRPSDWDPSLSFRFLENPTVLHACHPVTHCFEFSIFYGTKANLL